MSAARLSVFALCGLACAGAPPVPVFTPWDAPGANKIVVPDDEEKLWAQADEAIGKLQEKRLLVEDEPLVGYITSVLKAVSPVVEQASAPRPAVYIVRSSDLSAASMANCAILVPVGVLAALENEAQLAALLGHELGHCLNRHHTISNRYEAVSKSTLERSAADRSQEVQADRWALRRTIAAGYDARESLRLLAIVAGDDVPHWGYMTAWRSHPYVNERIALLRTEVPSGGKVAVQPYQTAVRELLPLAVELDLEERDTRRAQATLARYQRLAPGAARGYLLRGELARLVSSQGRRAPEVRAAYEYALRLAPDDPNTIRTLGLLLRELGEEARARALLNRYVQLAPEGAPDLKLIRGYLK